MNERPERRIFWLIGLAVLLAAATAADYVFFGDDSGGSRPGASSASTRVEAPKQPPRAGLQTAGGPQTIQALRERLAYLRRVEQSATEVRQAYAEVAIPYAEAMVLLPTYFRAGSEPRAALEGAVRGLAGESGLAVDSLLVAAPQRVGPGVYEGAATITVRGGDSGAMLRFFAEAGRPGNGMVWNDFQLSADAQNRQVSLAGELRVLLVESAE